MRLCICDGMELGSEVRIELGFEDVIGLGSKEGMEMVCVNSMWLGVEGGKGLKFVVGMDVVYWWNRAGVRGDFCLTVDGQMARKIICLTVDGRTDSGRKLFVLLGGILVDG
eukprot:3870554-Ditylum_brightwellii.AAC.1